MENVDEVPDDPCENENFVGEYGFLLDNIKMEVRFGVVELIIFMLIRKFIELLLRKRVKISVV